MHPEGIRESGPVFQYLVGKYKRVNGFNRYGFVEIDFKIRTGRSRGSHLVAIEPFLLRLRRSR
ncbi:MAG TPA: hypothetical protein VHL99_08560, partial [Candidatus Binatia bacterium]|nr:hypothetical protein [Candidatus Binatia bacterium]